MDERIKKLAKVLVNHSCRVQKGEKVYIHYVGYETKTLAIKKEKKFIFIMWDMKQKHLQDS